MLYKTIQDLRAEMLDAFSQRLPNIDLTEGTPERDIFIEAPLAGQIYPLWQQLSYIYKLHAPLTYYNELDSTDLINYAANFNVFPRGATYSTGNVTFYTTTQPTQDIFIPDGTIVTTLGASPLSFAVQGNYTMYASIAASYYNAVTQRWEITCPVKALVAGSTIRAGSNSVTKMKSAITGLSGVTNESPITGGTDAESVEDMLRRVIEVFQGRGLGTTQGLKNYVRTFVKDVNIVGANDVEMLRDNGVGGAIDIYIIGETLTNDLYTVYITSSGLSNPIDVTYTSTEIILRYAPVKRIISVSKNGSLLPSSAYTLTLDTGVLALSTRAMDKVVLTSSGLIAGYQFVHGDTVEINYVYNSLPKSIEDDLNSPQNHFINRDYLVREMRVVTVDTFIRIREEMGQDFVTVKSLVETTISTFINSVLSGGSIELADVIGEVKKHQSVDNIDLSSVAFTISGGGTITAQGDILLGKNEYPQSGTITVEQWVR